MARAAAFGELNAAGYYKLSEEMLPLDHPLLRPYAAWARRSAWLCSYLGILWADLEDISPTVNTTREQAAASIYALMRFCGYVPLAA